MDKGVQCNTLKIHIQELNSKIDNLIAEKDDMIEYKDYYVHVKIFRFYRKFLDFIECAKGCPYTLKLRNLYYFLDILVLTVLVLF